MSLPFLSTHLPNRFKVPPSLQDISFRPDWEIPCLSPEQNKEILSILSSPFTYLSKGNQSYVFASSDGEYVLKLFRYRCTRFPILQSIKEWAEAFYKTRPKDDFIVKTNKTFRAARMAFVEGKEFTKVAYCHLNLTKNLLPKTQLITPHRTVYLPMDRYRFVLQKRVTPFAEALLSAKCNADQMHAMIDSFAALLIERTEKGIRNSDPNLAPNFGFFEGKAVEMDFGNYRPISPDAALRRTEMDNFMLRFRNWLQKNAPEYVGYLDKKQREMQEI